MPCDFGIDCTLERDDEAGRVCKVGPFPRIELNRVTIETEVGVGKNLSLSFGRISVASLRVCFVFFPLSLQDRVQIFIVTPL